MRRSLIASALMFAIGLAWFAFDIWHGKPGVEHSFGDLVFMIIFWAAVSFLLPLRFYADEIRDKKAKETKKLKDTFK